MELEEIQEVAIDFYRDLLTMDEPLTDRDICRQQIWGHIQRRVIDGMQLSLARPFWVAKLQKALSALPRDSYPRVDGLSAGFFVSFWELLGDDLCASRQEIVDSGCMPRPTSLFRGAYLSYPQGGGGLQQH